MMTIMVAISVARSIFRKCKCFAIRFDLELREFLRASLVDPYHCGLLVQAEYLYRNSELFQIRLKERGYMSAVESFHGGVALYFFEKARRMPRHTRLRIFMNAILGKEPRAYL